MKKKQMHIGFTYIHSWIKSHINNQIQYFDVFKIKQ